MTFILAMDQDHLIILGDGTNAGSNTRTALTGRDSQGTRKEPPRARQLLGMIGACNQ